MNKVPKLRFPEFSGEWEEKKLGGIDIKLTRGPFGSALKKEFMVNKSDNTYKVYEQKHAIKKSINIGEYYVNEEKYLELKRFEVLPGDFIMSCSGTIGEIFKIPKNAEKGIINQALLKIEIGKKINEDYFLYCFRKNLNGLETKGSGIKNVTSVKFLKEDFILSIPSLKEQQKIASFLLLVDKKIEKQQEKVEALKDYKKGMVQKIFSHEIRFKGDNGHWNQYLLGNIIELYDNKRKPVKEQDRVNGKYAYYGATGIIDYINSYIFEGEYLLLGEDGANIITRSAPLIYKTQGKFWVNNHAHIFKPKKQFDIEFMKQCLELIDYTPYNTGTAQPKLNAEAIKLIPLKAPCYKEQQKIANFLSTIDKKLEKEQEKLDSLNQWKKGLLQQMFV